MAETPSQIESHIEQMRDELGSNIQELEQKVKTVTDWKYQFRQRPVAMLGAAFGAGVFVAAILPRSKRRPVAAIAV
jgi:hypothetical protein